MCICLTSILPILLCLGLGLGFWNTDAWIICTFFLPLFFNREKYCTFIYFLYGYLGWVFCMARSISISNVSKIMAYLISWRGLFTHNWPLPNLTSWPVAKPIINERKRRFAYNVMAFFLFLFFFYCIFFFLFLLISFFFFFSSLFLFPCFFFHLLFFFFFFFDFPPNFF